MKSGLSKKINLDGGMVFLIMKEDGRKNLEFTIYRFPSNFVKVKRNALKANEEIASERDVDRTLLSAIDLTLTENVRLLLSDYRCLL